MYILKKKSHLFQMSLLAILFLLLFSGVTTADETNSASTAIDELMKKSFDADGPGAVVIVTKEGKLIFTGAYGKANLELGVNMHSKSVLHIASITKQFTAVCIMMLVEQGKLSLEDGITKYFPDYPVKGNKITIRHLLTHTSGIPDYVSIEGFNEKQGDDLTVEQWIDFFKDEPFNFKPGDRFDYSNSGYYLLGAIIEKISYITYDEFLTKYIFKPLEMTNSYSGNNSQLIRNRVDGYELGDQGFLNATYRSMTGEYAAGVILSTVSDLAKWDAALYTEKLITQESLEQCHTSYELNDGRKTGYGFGWGLTNLKGHNNISHNGRIPGFQCSGSRFPDEKLYVALLSNNDKYGSNLGMLVSKISAIALGDPFVDPVKIKLMEEDLKKVAGIYKLGENAFREIIFEKGKLYSQREQGPKMQIFPTSKTNFVFENSLTVFEFVFDDIGNVTKMISHTTDGRATPATRGK